MIVLSRPQGQQRSPQAKSSKIIQDRAMQMERWVQHYSESYFRENVVTKEALNAIKCLPWLKELDSDPPLKN